MTEDERDYYEERAGIREFDAGYTRDEAEKLALQDIENMRHDRRKRMESVKNA
jgi:hypothetical protein